MFLGWFFEWDPETTPRGRGARLRARGERPRTGRTGYTDIDDDFISLHHWMKWFKFGFTRTWDNLALEIRNGRMTRDKAIEVLRERQDETPREDIEAFCRWAGITEDRFFEIAETFRNRTSGPVATGPG